MATGLRVSAKAVFLHALLNSLSLLKSFASTSTIIAITAVVMLCGLNKKNNFCIYKRMVVLN